MSNALQEAPALKRTESSDWDYKLCTKCGRELHVSWFMPKPDKKSGLRSWCRKCISRSNMATHAANPEKKIYNAAKCRAKAKGVAFDIELSDIVIPDVCPVLGIPLAPQVGRGSGMKRSSPSLDRIVPGKGYTKGNVVIISARANSIKKDATPDELIKLARFYRKYALSVKPTNKQQ